MAERADAGLDGVHDRLGQPEHGDEQAAHDGGEDQQAPDLVDQDGVELSA